METFKKPLIIIVGVAAGLAILGALMGWFTIGNQLVRELAESELNKKQSISMGVSLGALLLCLAAAKIAKPRLALLATCVAVYGLILVINQKPDAPIVEQIGLIVKPGYWMSIIGSLAMAVSSAIIGIKGFSFGKSEE